MPADTQFSENLPLAGITVLDFGQIYQGPYCSMLMAKAGANVIKIEPPEGDDMRLRTPMRQGHSAYFGQLNAGKRSLALDQSERSVGIAPRARIRPSP